ncbi:MAG: colanic acid/amylovoran biosynthesis glycosyltransferase [Lentisphaeria bacterium]
MKIAYFVSEYPARSHTFIRREIKELRKRGADIHVLAIRKQAKNTLICEQDWSDYNETWSILPISILALFKIHLQALLSSPLAYFKSLYAALKHRNPGFNNIIWAIFQFAEAIVVAKEIQARQIKHMHIHFSNAGANIGYCVNVYSGVTWSMTLHGACDFEFPAGPLLGEKLLSCSFANCASYYGKSQAYRTVGAEHWDKLFVSRCGIDVEAMPETPQRQKGETVRIMCVGRISTEKGHLGLIEACAQAFSKNDNLELILVGDGPDRGIIEAKIKEKGIQDKVTLTGSVSEAEVLERVATVDLFALPSLMEGIPLVLMEAMALEVPVIAPRIAGIPELIEDQVNGLLYRPGDWSEMAEKITLLANNPTLMETLGRKGKEKVLGEFVIHKSVDPLWEKLKEFAE